MFRLPSIHLSLFNFVFTSLSLLNPVAYLLLGSLFFLPLLQHCSISLNASPALYFACLPPLSPPNYLSSIPLTSHTSCNVSGVPFSDHYLILPNTRLFLIQLPICQRPFPVQQTDLPVADSRIQKKHY